MLKPLLGFSALMLLGPTLQQSATKPAPPPPAAPETATATVNPFKPNAESLARAKKVYGYDCAICHGATGDGKGDVGADFKVKVKDYTDPANLKEMTDADIFNIIKNGKGDMPPEGGRLKDQDLWSLVTVVRSFGKK
jgi:mono/diheme cytochrome c family protein